MSLSCSVKACTRKVKSRGFCGRHYRSLLRYGDPLASTGRRSVHEISFRDHDGRKQCVTCEEWLAEDQFNTKPGPSGDGLRVRCRRCLNDYKRGLTFERRQEFLAEQDNSCLCGKTFDVYGGRGVTYFVDHDHSCCPGVKSCGDCIRGLLCSACNLALGHVGDDPAVLSKLIDYLTARAS